MPEFAARAAITSYVIDTTRLFIRLTGAGLSTISILGSGAGIGIVSSGSTLGAARNPKMSKQLSTYAILGPATSEAIALSGLMATSPTLSGSHGKPYNGHLPQRQYLFHRSSHGNRCSFKFSNSSLCLP